ncbi:MAG: hypothetical protein IJO04_00155 [Oscillospiraceae bacterium]|nr:hypothetical protein [Oscillospiraceae bacterium]
MKKCWILMIALLFLTGCGAQETFEKVSDVYVQPVSSIIQQVILDIPDDAGIEVLQSADSGKIYLCDGYTITVQTMVSGDLDKTVRTVTGYGAKELELLQTRQSGLKKYECVWSAAGEAETQIGRACILDDGDYHYVVTVMAGESVAGTLRQTWQELFASFRLLGADVELNTGS